MTEIVFHEITDDGKVVFYNENDKLVRGGEGLDDYIKFFKEDIIEELKEFVEIENECFDEFKVHLETPPPGKSFIYEYQRFSGRPPIKPKTLSKGLFGRIIPSIKRRVDDQNQVLKCEYEKKLKSFEKKKKRHEEQQKEWKVLIEKGRFESSEKAEEFLDIQLETGEYLGNHIIFQVSDDIKFVKINVSPIPIEEIPEKRYEIDQVNLRTKAKKINKAEKNKIRYEATYSAIFRILGETFVLLPSVNKVMLGIFNDIEDSSSCIFSVLVNRNQWEELDFDEIQKIDVVNVIDSFFPNIKLTKFFEMKPTPEVISGET